MRILLDTNILIPLEPTRQADVEPNSPGALELARYAASGGHQLHLHPGNLADIARDRDPARLGMRMLLLRRYPDLPNPPTSQEVERLLGVVNPSANDAVDNPLLAAVHGDAVDFLVTEDEGIHQKARRLGIDDRVLTLVAAIETLRDLFDTTPRPPPHVEAMKAHGIDPADPIFNSFREDYPAFDAWLSKVRRQHRDAWVIRNAAGGYSAVAIVKAEEEYRSRPGRTLKLCSFKVDDIANGWKFGELLLKAIFEYCAVNEFARVYSTAFERHERLLHLFTTFGFSQEAERTPAGELIVAKELEPPDDLGGVDALTFNVRYGPRRVRSISADPGYIVPIQPPFHDALFPEARPQQVLAAVDLPKPFGNAIRKAYLCNANIRRLQPGNNVFFYRSLDRKDVRCTGVVESISALQSPAEIARLVGTRTVYRFDEIEKLCQRREVLVIMFRHAFTLRRSITFAELQENGCLVGPPQSILAVRDDGRRWLETCIQERLQ
jgi:L-amino acid N-acyltransferase YncA